MRRPLSSLLALAVVAGTLASCTTEKRALPIAARHADAWHSFGGPADMAARSQKLSRLAEEAGRNPDELISTNQLPICVGERSKIEGPMKNWLQTEWDYASWSESTMDSAIMGTPEECVEQLEAHIATGIDRIIFVPYKYEMEQLQAIATDILPKLKARMG